MAGDAAGWMTAGLVAGTAAVLLVEQGRQAAYMRRRLLVDELTGLPNRAALVKEMAARRASGRPWSLVMADLDRFKPINDRYGHRTGDLVLIEVAERLAIGAGEHGMTARLHGDEYAMVLPFAAEVAAVLVARVRVLVAEPMPVDGAELRVGMSAGIVDGDPDLSADEMLRRADLAMYASKQAGEPIVWRDGMTQPTPSTDCREVRGGIELPSWLVNGGPGAVVGRAV